MAGNTAQITTTHFSDHDLLPEGSSKSLDAVGNPKRTGLGSVGNPKRTGTVWTASAYIVAGVTAPGLLNFAWHMAQLGWIAGPLVIILFSFISYFASTILCTSYRSPDDTRNPTYMDAIRSNFDRPIVHKICWVLQYLSLLVFTSWSTHSASTAMADINWFAAKCYNSDGVEPCYVYLKPYYIAFGVFQIFLSQIPNFHQLRWLSVLCGVMFLLYSSILLGLATAKVAENGKIKGSLTGMSIGPDQVTRAQKTWKIFQAIGDIAQAYDFSNVLLEIQDTVGSPPSEVQTMKKATSISVAVLTIISMIFACMGYAALGEASPEFLRDGFYKPYWLMYIANAAIVINLAGGNQLFAQPIFAMVEELVSGKFPDNKFVTKEINIWIPRFGYYNYNLFRGYYGTKEIKILIPTFGFYKYKYNLFRLVWRTFFVTAITLLSMFFAVYLDVLKLIGTMTFWPIVIYFPVEMYIVQKRTPKWSARWVGLQILSFGCLIVTIAAVAGNVVDDFLDGSYKPIMPNRY